MKHRRSPLPLLVLTLALFAVLAIGCVRAASPRGWAAPVQDGDVLLVSTSRGKLDAIDSAGSVKWRFPDDWKNDAVFKAARKEGQSLQGIYASPVIGKDNTIYVADYNGYVYALHETAPGEKDQVRWVRQTDGPVIGGLAFDATSDTLFVTSADGKLYGLKAAEGSDRITPVETEDRIWSAPAVVKNQVLVASTDKKVYGVNIATGARAWPPFTAGGPLVSISLSPDGALLLVGGFDSRLYAIDTATGVEKWSFQAANWVWSRALVDGSAVYVADFDGKVYALGLNDGKPLWQKPFDAAAPVKSGPAIAGGVLVVANENGDLFGIDPATGSQTWVSLKTGVTAHADLVARGSNVLLVPSNCAEDIQTKLKVYYYTVSAAEGKLQPTLSDKGC